VRLLGWIGLLLGAAGVVTAVVMGLWPLHENGVSGSALVPHYSRYFGFSAAGPMPRNPTQDDLRRAGVVFPMDVVHDRRLTVSEVFAGSVLLLVAGAAAVVAGRRRPDHRSVD
jgi:hypothetical protein